MRYIVHYEERDNASSVYRFKVESRFIAETWATDAVREGPCNSSRVVIYEGARPLLKVINIAGEAVRIECDAGELVKT